MQKLSAILLLALAACSSANEGSTGCIDGETDLVGQAVFTCRDGLWVDFQNPSPSSSPAASECTLPNGSWLMSKTLVSGSVLCPTLADELFVVPSATNPFVGTGCEVTASTSMNVTNDAGTVVGCATTTQIACSDGSSLTIDQDMFDGGFGLMYGQNGSTSCLYETQIRRAR